MPYPSQTSAEKIRTEALALLLGAGEKNVTVRGVAKRLGLSANALYGYYPDRDALLAELASEGARQLRRHLSAATVGKEGRERLYALADAYVGYALGHEAIYRLMMAPHHYTVEQEKVFADLWLFVKEVVATVAPQPEVVAVTLWGFLHGMVGLEQAAVFHVGKPRTGIRPGLEALLSGFAH